MRHLRWLLFLVVVFLGGSLQVSAQTTIKLTKSGVDVALDINGTPTFSVYRSSRPDWVRSTSRSMG